MPSFAERRDLANQVAETKDALGAGGRDFDFVDWLLNDPKEGLLTTLGAAGPAGVGGAVFGGLRRAGSGPSPRLVAAARQLLARLSKGPLAEAPAWSTDLPSDIARSIEGTVGATLQKYRPQRAPDLGQPIGKLMTKPGEFLVSRPDLEQSLLEEVQRKLPQFDPSQPDASLVKFLWAPLRNRASDEARTTLSRTSLPAPNSLEMEVARLKKLHASTAQDVQSLLDLLRKDNPRPTGTQGGHPVAAWEHDAPERVARALSGQQNVGLDAAQNLRATEPLPDEMAAEAESKLQLLQGLQAIRSKLTPRQQAAFSMYYGLGYDSSVGQSAGTSSAKLDRVQMSLDEIARALSRDKPLSRMTISNDIQKARKVLAAELGVELPDEARATGLTAAAQARAAAAAKPSTYENVAGNVVVTDPGVAPATAGVKGVLSGSTKTLGGEGAADRVLARKAFGQNPPRTLDPSRYTSIQDADGSWHLVEIPPISGGAGGKWNESRTPEPVLRQLRQNMGELLQGRFPAQEPDPATIQDFGRGSLLQGYLSPLDKLQGEKAAGSMSKGTLLFAPPSRSINFDNGKRIPIGDPRNRLFGSNNWGGPNLILETGTPVAAGEAPHGTSSSVMKIKEEGYTPITPEDTGWLDALIAKYKLENEARNIHRFESNTNMQRKYDWFTWPPGGVVSEY